VRNPELESIRSLDTFANPEGIEVKYFSATLAGAQRYAAMAAGAFGDGPYTIVQTGLPGSLVTPEMTTVVDRGIPTVIVPTEQLPILTRPIVLGP
jgi:hypothetical protein